MDNFLMAVNKFWPNHPGTPQIISDIQNSEIVNKIVETELVKKAASVANETEDKFFSLRELYNKYSASWWHNTSTITESFSFFESWQYWLAYIIMGALLGIYVYDIKHNPRAESNIFVRSYNWLFHNDPKTPISGNSRVLFDQNSPGVDSVVDHSVTPPISDIKKGIKSFWNRITGNRVLQDSDLPTAPNSGPWTSPLERFRQFKAYFRSPESPLLNKGKGPDKPYNWEDPYKEARLKAASGSNPQPQPQPIPVNEPYDGSLSPSPEQPSQPLPNTKSYEGSSTSSPEQLSQPETKSKGFKEVKQDLFSPAVESQQELPVKNDTFGPSIESRFINIPDTSDIWARVYENKAKIANIINKAPTHSAHSSDTESLNSFHTSGTSVTPSLITDNTPIDNSSVTPSLNNDIDTMTIELEDDDVFPDWS